MANITKRKNAAGEVISYRIRVSRGYDAQGKKRKPYEMTWKPSANMTERQIAKALQKAAIQFEEQCLTGLTGDATKITLAEFAPIYLEQKKAALSPATYDYYERTIQSKILPVLGHYKLKDLKPIHVQRLVNQLCQTQKKNRDGSTNPEEVYLSPATVRRILTVLQSMLKLAVKRRIITENPAKAELLDIPKVTDPKIEIFTKQEATEMLQALETEPLQFQVLIQLAIMMGARRGELVALKFSDFDPVRCQVTIQRAAIKLPGEQAQIKPPKDYEVRTVAISQEVMQLVKALEQEKQEMKQHYLDNLNHADMENTANIAKNKNRDKDRNKDRGAGWKGDDWLFTQQDGQMMNPQTPTKQFQKFLERHGFRHRKFHSLRHTSATLLLYGGVSLKQVQGRLGHGDIETTNKYLHCLAEADTEAANVLQAMLTK
jgi:integrase